MTIYLSNYQTFNSTQELNHHVRQHEKEHSEELTASQREVLRFIARYSVKYAGAAHLKTSTIATGVDKSERTIRRILRRLESLEIIERVSTLRKKSGGSGANIIVILPFAAPRMSDREVTEKASEQTDKAKNRQKETFTKREEPSYTNDTLNTPLALKNSLPCRIYEAISPFFDGKDLYRTVGTLYKAKASVDSSIQAEDHTEYIDTFLSCVRRYKEGKIRNLQSYLYASWKKVSRMIKLKEMAHIYL
ncbi:helix-turn-helix domain-containing protein [Halobacillus mangrovi]|uniref:Uncharacterized protein n=1 Tax=Halobacillus mangrovi TaxID=402384 RepID=A0A1W5ZY25_9BACI|nr:helix-turn-helix domain-containing protein [Halobacillus mangrovi]ARI78245.1 hypothetical protein HM131_15910 [Halobacillus mangrovi]